MHATPAPSLALLLAFTRLLGRDWAVLSLFITLETRNKLVPAAQRSQSPVSVAACGPIRGTPSIL